jgi:hypothetical protein
MDQVRNLFLLSSPMIWRCIRLHRIGMNSDEEVTKSKTW